MLQSSWTLFRRFKPTTMSLSSEICLIGFAVRFFSSSRKLRYAAQKFALPNYRIGQLRGWAG